MPASRSAALLIGVTLLGLPVLLAPATNAAAPAGWEELLSTPAHVALSGVPAPAGGAPGPDAETRVTDSVHAQNEPAIAVNPLDPANLIVGWNDYDIDQHGAYVWTGIANSKDGGATWSDRPLAPHPRDPVGFRVIQALGYPRQYSGDPIVAFNGRGVGLYGGMFFEASGGYRSALVVSPTLDKGDSHTPVPVAAAWAGRNGLPSGLTDKPWMRGDPNGPWFYICWTHFGGPDINIWFVASGDGMGLTWTPPKKISNEGGVQGCDIGVGPDGEVYVTYVDFTWGLTSGGQMKVVKSTDHGVTFSAPRSIGTVLPLNLPNSAFRYAHFPRIAVDMESGDVHVVWAEGSGDVVHVKSADGGATWTPKALVNNDGTGRAQYFPAIDVGPDGKVTVGFYDRRDDPANRHMKYYYAESTDGGATFPVQYAVSPTTTDGLNTTWWFIGDYTDIRTGSDGKANGVWTAAPPGTNQDIFYTSG